MITHPEDPKLVFPYVRETLDSPETMLKNIYEEYMENKQDYDPQSMTLYRVYERDHTIDAVSSHFTEHIRVQCSSGTKPTLVQVWKSLSPEKIKEFKDTDSLRQYMFNEYKAGECNYFHAGLCIRLYLEYNLTRHPIKIIDPSAGWGCRMLTAIACGDHVSEYVGYDPNPDLALPYKQIMETLDHDKKCSFYNIPFETAPVKVGYFDLGVTSPPYFDLEIYSKDKNQSFNPSTSRYDRWIESFYRPYLHNLVRAIKNGGRIIIYVSNFRLRGQLINLADDTLKIYEIHPHTKLINIGYLKHTKEDRFPRPFYIFDVVRD